MHAHRLLVLRRLYPWCERRLPPLNRFFDDFANPLIEALSQVSPEGGRKLVAERRARHAPP